MALISALLIIILITSLLSSLYHNQISKLNRIENTTSIIQSKFLLNALTDAIRYLLRDDFVNGKPVDSLREIWALPVSDSGLNILFEKYQLSEKSINTNNIFISYKIEDAQSRFNLANLAGFDEQSKARAVKSKEIFKQLILKFGINKNVEAILIDRIQLLISKTNSDLVKSGKSNIVINEAEIINGLEQIDIDLLKKFVYFLPEQTLININTVELNIMQSLVLDITQLTVEKIMERRLEKPFSSISELNNFVATIQPGIKFPEDLISVRSNYFEVYAAIRNGSSVISKSMLISRKSGRLPVTEIVNSKKEDFKIY